MTLNVRQPTGKSAPPMILLDGPEKVGKSATTYELSASDRVGDMFVFPILERSADEYQKLGPYQIVDTDGTWAGFTYQLVEAIRQPMDPAKPNVIALDTGTALWGGLSAWVDRRARNSATARATLAKDPDAEIDAGQNIWNDAKDRWRHMLDMLSAWGGISIIVARGDEVTPYKDGQIVRNAKPVYRAQIEKTTPFRTTANVRIPTFRNPRLMGLTKLGVEIPADGLALPREGALEHLIFEIMGVTAGTQEIVPLVGATAGSGSTSAATKAFLIARATALGLDERDATAIAAATWHEVYPEKMKVDEVPETVVDRLRSSLDERLARFVEDSRPSAPVSAPEPSPATTPAPAVEQADTSEAAAVSDEDPADKGDNGGSDAMADAMAFISGVGGDLDGPSADPESIEGFDDAKGADDDRFEQAGVSPYGD